jgi:ribosomal protein L31E
MTTERERVLCISLTQEEWHAFTSRCPQPVEWLRQQILQHIETKAPADVTVPRRERTESPYLKRS